MSRPKGLITDAEPLELWEYALPTQAQLAHNIRELKGETDGS